MFLINPEILEKSETTSIYEEGCLSFQDNLLKLKDYMAFLKYLDLNGNQKKLKASGLLSTCIQHEVDHLNGVLFIDYLSKLKKRYDHKKAS